jgi:hypothetical protein
MTKGTVISLLICVALVFWTLPNVCGFLFAFIPDTWLELKLFVGMSMYFLLPLVFSRAFGIYLAVILDVFIFNDF